MKRAASTISIVLWIGVLAGYAQAQVGTPAQEAKYFRIPHKYHVYVELAGALPVNPGLFNDFWNSSFHFSAGGGVAIFPWLDVNANYTYTSWPNNSTDSKVKIGYQGVPEVEGGLITTMTISGSARFLAAPNARTNPFAEFTVGYYSTTAEDIVIEGVLENSMDSVSGLMFAPSVGIQYAMADSWSAYAKYAYVVCLSDEFAPGELLQPVGGGEPVPGDNQVYSVLGVGIMLRF